MNSKHDYELIIFFVMSKNNFSKKDIYNCIINNHTDDEYVRKIHPVPVCYKNAFLHHDAFAKIIRKYKKRYNGMAFLYVLNSELSDVQMKLAASTKIPHGIILLKRQAWKAVCVNKKINNFIK